MLHNPDVQCAKVTLPSCVGGAVAVDEDVVVVVDVVVVSVGGLCRDASAGVVYANIARSTNGWFNVRIIFESVIVCTY
jgi:hypothetical protein